VTMWIFEMHNIASASMANQVKVLLDSFGLLDKVVAYVKSKGFAISITMPIYKVLFWSCYVKGMLAIC